MISVEDASRMIVRAVKVAESVVSNLAISNAAQQQALRVCETHLKVAQACYELAVEAEQKMRALMWLSGDLAGRPEVGQTVREKGCT